MALTAGYKPKVANDPKAGQTTNVITNATGAATMGSITNCICIYTAGAQGGRVVVFNANTNDTVAVNVYVLRYSGTTPKPSGMVNVPLRSGDNGTASGINMLDPNNTAPALKGCPTDEQNNRFFPLAPSESLYVGTLAAVTSGKSIWFDVEGYDYQA